ncbi:hypothetical protein [Taibaiella soli]|uniref:Uncharacterized protein n=1 Tax=Taibaiella soli TaxID=1649169 RepID=A0A2W2AUX9_9BACT|nr:hypothetical protein [Taibaiella soli]PZF71488.1 hypothetical protein DN068_18145 [Taibaiella soli]
MKMQQTEVPMQPTKQPEVHPTPPEHPSQPQEPIQPPQPAPMQPPTIQPDKTNPVPQPKS